MEHHSKKCMLFSPGNAIEKSSSDYRIGYQLPVVPQTQRALSGCDISKRKCIHLPARMLCG